MKDLKFYNGLDVENSLLFSLVSANTISASTFYGSLNAQYLASGITNTKFSYNNTLVDYIQPQLNNKALSGEPFLIFSNDVFGSQKTLIGGTDITIKTGFTSDKVLMLNSGLSLINVSSITDNINISYPFTINNYSPVGFSDSIVNINLNPNSVIKITGISGTTSGRNLILQNISDYLIILENIGTASTSNNQFYFTNKTSYFLKPNSQIQIIYNSTINKWTDTINSNNGLINYDYFKLSDTFDGRWFPNSSVVPARTLRTTFPKNGNIFSIESNPNNLVFNQTAFYSSENGLRIFRGIGTTPGTRYGRISVGYANSDIDLQTSSANSLTIVSKFSVLKPSEPFLSNSDNWVISFGTNNNLLSSDYPTLTNNNTAFPNFGGGSFWLFDWKSNQNYARYAIQSTSNTSTVGISSFNLSDIQSEQPKIFGIYHKPLRNSVDSVSTFFWANISGESENYTIEQPLSGSQISNGTIKGVPSLIFYGNSNYTPESNINDNAKVQINYLVIDKDKL
jgi:hypothetical protein